MKQIARLLAGACLPAALAACGGSGGVTRVAPSTPVTKGVSSAHFVLTIPQRVQLSATRRAAYVSPSTLSGTVQVNGGAVTELDLSVASPLCTTVAGGRACNISVPAPVGADTFALVLYDGAYTGGVHTGNPLSAASPFAATIVEGSSNATVPLILGGLPASVDVTASALTAGTAATEQLVVSVFDAQGNLIVGPAAFANAAGVAAPVTVALAIAPAGGQVTLHNGAQNGTSITVAGPYDTPTIQLSAPADILGIPFKVTDFAGTTMPVRVAGQSVAVAGTLHQNFLAATFVDFPDYSYFGPLNTTLAAGVPNGFMLSTGTQSFGEYVGYFNSASETFFRCSATTFNLAIAAVDNGVGFAYNGAYNVDTPPYGVSYLPLAAMTISATPPSCGAGTTYRTDLAGAAHATALAFDTSAAKLFEGETDNTFRSDAFSGTAFSANANIASYASPPRSIVVSKGQRLYLTGANNTIYEQDAANAPYAAVAAGTSFTSLAVGPDGSTFALDSAGHHVYRYVGHSAPVPYTAGALPGTQSTQDWNLAIGPDAAAYSSDGASSIQVLTATGTTSTLALPPPSGNIGFVRALFDGHNGYVYAFYDDGLHAGQQYVFRLSN